MPEFAELVTSDFTLPRLAHGVPGRNCSRAAASSVSINGSPSIERGLWPLWVVSWGYPWQTLLNTMSRSITVRSLPYPDCKQFLLYPITWLSGEN